MEKRVRQLNISAEEMDKRTSAARRLNKNENNRLRQQYEHFQDNHEVLTTEIEQEMKKIQHELNGIREITGYEEYARSTGEHFTDNKNSSSKRKRKQRARPKQRNSKTNEKSRRRLTRDESVGVNKVRFSINDAPSRLITRKSESQNVLPRNLSTAPVKSMPQLASTVQRISRSGITKKEEKLPQIRTSARSESRPLLEVDSVSEAREQARKRLLGEQSSESIDREQTVQSPVAKESVSDEDVESYMYVPPDGRKRTVYLIPPLEDLLKEASKARYLRMPKRLFDDDEEDPEKELSIDEIFSK